jgi:phage terminase large subunit
MKFTPLYYDILEHIQCRTQIHQGGTSSSKTISILQALYTLALKSTIQLIISVTSESLPHLKRGCIRDFFSDAVVGENYIDANYNKTENIYKINKSLIEFFSANSPEKLQARRDILYINEANNISKTARDQMEVRTKRKEFIDYNPTHEFWAHELIRNKGVYFKKSTYLDNPYLDQRIIASIESRKNNSNWWRVYGLGETGSIEGLVFPNYQVVDCMPDNMDTRYGLDWGFSNDQTAFIEIGVAHGNIYVDELIYNTGLTNSDIILKFARLGIQKHSKRIWADIAEPKSIEEVSRYGYNIKGARKLKGFKNATIDFIRRYKLCITERSTNVIKEIRSFSYQKDKTGKYINELEEGQDHAMHALIYAFAHKIEMPSRARSISTRRY